MKGRLKVRLGLAAVAVGIVAVAAQPASASTGVATIAGTGNFAVGLGLNGPPQDFDFNGQGAIATDSAQGEILCGLAGQDTIGSIAQGQGVFDGECDTTAGQTFVQGVFTRVGTFVDVSGIANGVVTGIFTGSCVFSPLVGVTTTPLSVVVNGFAVSCQFVIR